MFQWQVCNPSIQFMIYETSLKRLQAKRTANKHGVKPVTALEVQPLSYIKHLGITSYTIDKGPDSCL